MYSAKEIKEWKLRHCRLYDGNQKNVYESILKRGLSFREPFESFKEDKTADEINEILAIFYSDEKAWIILDKDNHFSKNPYSVSQFESDLGKDFGKDDGTPRDLQVMLYTGFLQFIDGVYHRFDTQYEIDLFKRYYKEYYQPIPTAKEKREQERRPKLIEKCTYYKGEKENPWEFCYSPVLVWRKKIWNIEKEWADAMVCSYRCPQSSRQLIKDLALVEFFKTKGIAISLLNLLLTKEQEESGKIIGPVDAINFYEKYRKWAPLGYGPEKYFAFYMGEDKSPFEYSDTDYSGLLWLQESIVHSNLLTDKNWLSEWGAFLDHTQDETKDEVADGVDGWMHDSRYPLEQRKIWSFCGGNILCWMPYADIDKIGEQYINFHYSNTQR